MGFFNRVAHHLDLMGAMFQRTGALKEGTIADDSEHELRQAMFRCTACDSVEACEHWLAEGHESEPPPAFCKNAALIDRMREAHP